jgi:hypothetical protein
MKFSDKQIVRAFIIEKIRETTCLELGDLAYQYDLNPFYVAECFEIECDRIEKMFYYPERPHPTSPPPHTPNPQ